MTTRKIVIIEDNQGDITLIKKGFNRHSSSDIQFSTITDGEEALMFIEKLQDTQGNFPHLIMLDLNLPKVEGKILLQKLKQHEATKKIPVVVFSSSVLKQDVLDVYNANGNCYIHKPIELDQYFKSIKSIEDFWFNIAHFPEIDDQPMNV